jgi:hypothetical protein
MKYSPRITLVDYFYELLIPYANMPEFTTCVMKAMEKLGHALAKESFYEESGPISEAVYDKVKSCRLSGKELCDE